MHGQVARQAEGFGVGYSSAVPGLYGNAMRIDKTVAHCS